MIYDESSCGEVDKGQDMRFLLLLALLTSSRPLPAQTLAQGADRVYPAPWAVLLSNLTRVQVDKMQSSANKYCRSLDYSVISDLYVDVGNCTLMQAAAIMSVDSAITGLMLDKPSKYRADKIKKCWGVYRALGSQDVENLAYCFGDVKYGELLEQIADSSTKRREDGSSTYCDKVAQAAGGSFVILEECLKQENASRRRLGR